MKTKKSISLILALVMVLALACGAWAAAVAVVDAGVGENKTASGDITESPDLYGLYAHNGGTIVYTGGTITRNGANAIGIYANYEADVQAAGAIVAQGANAHGLIAENESNVEMTGDITTDGLGAHGIFTWNNAAMLYDGGFVEYSGNITVHGNDSSGVEASSGYEIILSSTNITVKGDNAIALAAISKGIVTMTDGSLVTESDASWNIVMGSDGVINLGNVTTEGENLLRTSSRATITIEDGSVLTGNILHLGDNAAALGTLDITIVDSVWTGAAVASADIGSIDITLKNGDWNITGDTNTNGKVTADADSNIDFRGATDNIVVEIDSLAGDPGLNIKLDDELIIKNPAGSFESSDPSVIQIVKNADDSVSIIPLKDGDVTLTYQYLDENNKIQTGKIGVVSGSGGGKTGGGGSSGCNAGFGVLALLGLAFVYKKK